MYVPCQRSLLCPLSSEGFCLVERGSLYVCILPGIFAVSIKFRGILSCGKRFIVCMYLARDLCCAYY